MKVRDVMATEVHAVRPGESIHHAARLMSDAGIGFVPVTEADHPVGVLTDRDIVVRFVAAGGGDAAATVVSEVMTSKVTCVGPEDDLSVAAEAMHDGAVRRLVVVDAGVVVGVLSHGALVQATGGEGAGREATLGVTAGA